MCNSNSFDAIIPLFVLGCNYFVWFDVLMRGIVLNAFVNWSEHSTLFV